jgi:hypothetical protein
MQVPKCFVYPSIFVDADENLVMVDDVATPSNIPVEEEELEEAPLDVNVFQWSHKGELLRKVVCTQVDRLA